MPKVVRPWPVKSTCSDTPGPILSEQIIHLYKINYNKNKRELCLIYALHPRVTGARAWTYLIEIAIREF